MNALLVAAMVTAPVTGGEIFGEVRAGDAYAAAADVKLVCGQDTVAAKTDSTGSFRIRAKATGKCRFSISWKGQTPAVDVVLFERPTRYRLVIAENDGKLVLKRV